MKKIIITFTVLTFFNLFLASNSFGGNSIKACVGHVPCDACSYQPERATKDIKLAAEAAKISSIEKSGTCLFRGKKHELACVAAVSCK